MCIKRIKNVEFDLSFYTIDGKWVFAAIDNSKNTNIFLNEEKLKSSLFCKYLWEIPNDFSLSNSFPSTLCFLPALWESLVVVVQGRSISVTMKDHHVTNDDREWWGVNTSICIHLGLRQRCILHSLQRLGSTNHRKKRIERNKCRIQLYLDEKIGSLNSTDGNIPLNSGLREQNIESLEFFANVYKKNQERRIWSFLLHNRWKMSICSDWQ